jgi:hypothetical protein
MKEAQVVTGAYVSGRASDLPVAHVYESTAPMVEATAAPETDFDLARRLQEEEYEEYGGHAPRPPSTRVAVVDGRYFGATSCFASALLFCVFPPCAIIPCISPCDGGRGVVVVADRPGRRGRRRFARRARVVVPAHLRAGDIIQTTGPDGTAVSCRVPPRVGPGDSIAIEY